MVLVTDLLYPDPYLLYPDLLNPDPYSLTLTYGTLTYCTLSASKVRGAFCGKYCLAFCFPTPEMVRELGLGMVGGGVVGGGVVGRGVVGRGLLASWQLHGNCTRKVYA